MPRRVKDTPLDRLCAALANPTRRDILDALLAGERTAGELAATFDMARPSVSEHLAALRDSGLVAERTSGRNRYYSVTAAPLGDLADWLTPYERFWRGRLTALGGVLDTHGRRRPTWEGPARMTDHEAAQTSGWELPADGPADDATTVRVDQFFPHPPERVWRAITTPDLVARWMETTDFAAEVGHRFTVAGHRVEATGFSGTVAATVLAVEPPRLLRVSWGDAAVADGPTTTVTWVVEAEGRGTRLFLEHAGFDPDDPTAQLSRRIMGGGWRTLVMRRISEVLATG